MTVPTMLYVLAWGDFRQCSAGDQIRFAELAKRLGLDHLGSPAAPGLDSVFKPVEMCFCGQVVASACACTSFGEIKSSDDGCLSCGSVASGGDYCGRCARLVEESSEPGSSAADVDGASQSAGHHESVGERQGRQPGSLGFSPDDTKEVMPVTDPKLNLAKAIASGRDAAEPTVTPGETEVGLPPGAASFSSPDDAQTIQDALDRADLAASTAHDFIHGLRGVTQEEASAAIWVIHDAIRPLLREGTAPETAGVIHFRRRALEAEERLARAEQERDKAQEHARDYAGDVAREQIRRRELEAALREIEGMDTPATAEDVKDYQAMLYHRMRDIARSELGGSDKEAGC